MKEHSIFIVDELLYNETYTFESLLLHLKENPKDIENLKAALIDNTLCDHHDLLINYIKKHPLENRKEIVEEISKIYRKPFLTHRTSLSRVLIVNQEVLLHIIKNDVLFFRDGPERTSVNIIEESLHNSLGAFFPNYFSKENKVRKKEIYDALRTLEDETDPPLITTTRFKPGTGTGKRRRKRYCLTEQGFEEIIPIVIIILRDELDNLRNQIY